MLDVLERIGVAAGAASDADLARKMGLSQQSIAKARTTKVVPTSWLPKAATTFGVSLDWLYFGRGSMRPSEPILATSEAAAQEPPHTHESACARCTKLEARLDEVERERRELTAENRHLWKDNGELREKCARLEERQFQRNVGHGDNDAAGSAG